MSRNRLSYRSRSHSQVSNIVSPTSFDAEKDIIRLSNRSSESTSIALLDDDSNGPRFQAQDSSSSNRDSQDTHSSRNLLKNSKWKHFISGKYGFLILAVIVGNAGGFLLKYQLKNEETFREWIALPGILYLNVVNCLVVPFVFVMLSISMVELSRQTNRNHLTLRMLLVFAGFLLLSALEGVMWSLVLKSVSHGLGSGSSSLVKPQISFKCGRNRLVRVNEETNVVECKTQLESSESSVFEIVDVNGILEDSLEGNIVYRSFGEQVQGFFSRAFTSNLASSFSNGDFVSVMLIAVVFGMAVASTEQVIWLKRFRKTGRDSKNSTSTKGKWYFEKVRRNVVFDLLKQTQLILFKFASYILRFLPMAVLFMTTSNIVMSEDYSKEVVHNVLLFHIVFIIGTIIHCFVVLPGVYFFFTRCNPYVRALGSSPIAKKFFPAQIHGFCSSSSAATLPVSIFCVDSTQRSPSYLTRFVLTVGTTLNMQGLAMYFPMAVVFMSTSASNSGEYDIGASEMIGLLFVSAVVALAGSPVPNSGVVLLITVWTTVTNQTKLPNVFTLLVAIDWIIDRASTACNVSGHLYACLIVANMMENLELQTEAEHDDEDVMTMRMLPSDVGRGDVPNAPQPAHYAIL